MFVKKLPKIFWYRNIYVKKNLFGKKNGPQFFGYTKLWSKEI